ncbi:MAG: type 4a pilus biogenesis protein PilO [Deltaproteobacteria bacterium]|nr:type 4a pilus biogenesis protein PilO [Deltaproteobacteria bacterium]
MALTAQDLANNFNKLPTGQKLAGAGILVVLVTALNFFLMVSPAMDDTARRRADLRRLEDDLIQKQSIANNLAQFKHEKEILERRLAQALTELPNEANMAELISSLSEIGNKSGLVINNIEPQAEVRQSFYASIPIVMSVTGNYHEIGVFLDSLSKLARIVNVTNIRMASPKVENEKVVVQASYVATTFRFLPQAGGGK